MKSNALLNLSLVALLGTIPLAGGQTPELDLDRVTELLDAGIDLNLPNIPGIPDFPDIPQIAQQFDYGDAPDPSYPTLHANDGARHLVAPSADGFLLTLGSRIDSEIDGQPTFFSTGDDALGPFDDEDGISFLSPLQAGGIAEIEVWASGPGRLDAWIDFNGNGSWMDPGEQIFTGEPLAANLNALDFGVPASTPAGTTYARFRLSSQGMLAPVGAAQDGEVEDYQIKIDGDPDPDPETDWGDAPATYPVTAANSGAYHLMTNDLMLGTSVDSEPDGIPGSSALRDDLDSAIDDEDGITFISAILIGGNATLEAVASMPGRIDAWVDFNSDGDWNDIGEQVFVGHPVIAGVNNMNFPVPASASAGGTYARFRISSGGGLGPAGGSSDGEVEDYQIGIEPGQPNGELDWGDAPTPYPTLAADGGAVHMINNGIYLGAMCDPEGDGQPDPTAQGDDNSGWDDEDGVAFTTLQQGAVSVVSVIASASGYINAFLDFNGDGIWGAGEQIVLNAVANPGINSYSFTVPSSAATGHTVARVRINSTGGLGPSGFASDGEVEDHLVYIKAQQPPVLVDWGDAPDQIADAMDYPTMDLSSGASHQIDDLFLGEWIDPEPDGQSSAMALGDDLDGNDDDDGVRFLTPMVSGSYALVKVYPTMTGILDAWIDWNGDKDWTDVGEQVFNSVTVNPGQVLVFKVPKIKKPLKTFARFRLSHGGSSYDGHQIGGEVEDYRVKVGKKSGWVLEPKLPNMLALNWDAEPGMDYFIQNSATPQGWIRENLGEHEVPRVDELFPTGVAWDSLSTGDEGGEVSAVGEGSHPVLWDLSMMRPEVDSGPSQVRPWWVGPRDPVKMSREFGINRSKTMSLFRVIAMPE